MYYPEPRCIFPLSTLLSFIPPSLTLTPGQATQTTSSLTQGRPGSLSWNFQKSEVSLSILKQLLEIFFVSTTWFVKTEDMEVMKTNKLTDVGTRVTCSRPSRRRELYSLPWDRIVRLYRKQATQLVSLWCFLFLSLLSQTRLGFIFSETKDIISYFNLLNNCL